MPYQPIQNYGLIGNMRTAALVGMNGSIDWLCVPHFDSPSVFAAILDDEHGGRFQIAPCDPPLETIQHYWPDTNILVTRFFCADGVGEIEDFMPVGTPPRWIQDQTDTPVHDPKTKGQAASWHDQVIRRVKVTRGQVQFQLQCHPAFDYARATHFTRMTVRGAVFHCDQMSMILAASVPLRREKQGVHARFSLHAEQVEVFAFRPFVDGHRTHCPNREQTEELFQHTVDYWQRWLSQSTYTGRWREMVNRSALTLKLMTFEPTGAIIAAPTCSLPESLDGQRNWDYRYTWIRDAAFTIYGLLRIGFAEEATAFMKWLSARVGEVEPDGSLQIVYGIDGRHELTEQTLDHLDGYRGSRPVRIGNAAFSQLQLDIYGELLDTMYLYNKYVMPIGYDNWVRIQGRLNWLCNNWHRPDNGIWESRGGPRHFVYSKLMCWVAMDRGLRLAEKRSFPADRIRWQTVRDEIYKDIMTKGWNATREAFVQHYDSTALDASNLIMPLVFFVSPNDPRMLKTLETIYRSPQDGGLVSDGLVYRYDTQTGEDGLQGREGTFNMCTFWLVEALTRAGRVDRSKLRDARLLFEHMLGYANHLGLYAEEIGDHGEALGNFPQAFTHIALISAAFNLDRALDSCRVRS